VFIHFHEKSPHKGLDLQVYCIVYIVNVNLCMQPLEALPKADIVVMHKLMIEADKKMYLQTANVMTPINRGTW
jgi:hypothetical protein